MLKLDRPLLIIDIESIGLDIVNDREGFYDDNFA